MSTDVLSAGIYGDIDAARYHSDPCEGPSLSSSVAIRLCTESPLHAWTAHPKLNPQYQPDYAEQTDIGTAAHALLLEGRDNIVIVEADNWRTNAAKEARDIARKLGKVPLLERVYADVQAMVTAAQRQLAALKDGAIDLTNGETERTLIWREEDGIDCRARLDWLALAAIWIVFLVIS